MTRLFIRLYVGVLIVLFLAWYIHGAVLKRRADADRARVTREAHAGGARLVAREVESSPQEKRKQVLESLRERFEYPVEVVAIRDLPSSLQRRIRGGDEVAYFFSSEDRKTVVVAALSNASEVVRLGPFPSYDLQEIEDSIGGWMRLTADKLDAASPGDRPAVLEQLRERFEFPVALQAVEELPAWPQERIRDGDDIVFYPQPDARWFAATPLSNGNEIVHFGPFPSFEQIEQKAATTTLALVLLPAAFAIALLLRPVAKQLRQVEHAAKAIASGDLGARVDERRVRSAKPLAHAFNHMAARTETLVRAQRELLQAVSHELRTPLSRMRFAIDLIETAKSDAERKQRLDSLDAAASELDDLVGELLRYVRAETAEPSLNRESVAVQEALETLIPKYSAMHPAIEFGVNENDSEGTPIVYADRAGLQRVLGNLLSNAGRFAESRVTISSESIMETGTTNIDVDDDGGGIPASDRERIFQPFVRLEDKANGQGVGLGLALVQRIVAQHGGSVVVMTSPLGGCRIRTTWPQERVHP